MEKWSVVGFRHVDFEDQKTGKRVVGVSLFLERPFEKAEQGYETMKIFINPEIVRYHPQLSDDIELYYNKYGRVSDIKVL